MCQPPFKVNLAIIYIYCNDLSRGAKLGPIFRPAHSVDVDMLTLVDACHGCFWVFLLTLRGGGQGG